MGWRVDKCKKRCDNCSWYEPHHKNAGFCTSPSRFIEGVNTGVFVGGSKGGCEEHDLVDREEIVE